MQVGGDCFGQTVSRTTCLCMTVTDVTSVSLKKQNMTRLFRYRQFFPERIANPTSFVIPTTTSHSTDANDKHTAPDGCELVKAPARRVPKPSTSSPIGAVPVVVDSRRPSPASLIDHPATGRVFAGSVVVLLRRPSTPDAFDGWSRKHRVLTHAIRRSETVRQGGA